MPIRLRRPSPALIVALLALFVALGGPAQAQRLINGKQIRKGTVASKQVKNRSLKTRDLTRGAYRALRDVPSRSVGTAELEDAAVGGRQLQVGAVTAAALAPNSITGTSLADATIGAADLSEGAVTSVQIATGEVRKVDIAGGAVGTSEIQSGAVTGNEIRDGALGARDVADFSGVLQLTIPPVLGNRCVEVQSGGIAPNMPGATLLDDIVLVGRPQNWPPTLTLDARPHDATTIAVTVCNLSISDASARTATIPFVGIQP